MPVLFVPVSNVGVGVALVPGQRITVRRETGKTSLLLHGRAARLERGSQPVVAGRFSGDERVAQGTGKLKKGSNGYFDCHYGFRVPGFSGLRVPKRQAVAGTRNPSFSCSLPGAQREAI